MQLQLFEDQSLRNRPKRSRATPQPIGTGPDGELCRTCRHLYHFGHHGKVYLKCDLVERTHGAGTDIRARWPACRAWRPIEETISNESNCSAVTEDRQ